MIDGRKTSSVVTDEETDTSVHISDLYTMVLNCIFVRVMDVLFELLECYV